LAIAAAVLYLLMAAPPAALGAARWSVQKVAAGHPHSRAERLPGQLDLLRDGTDDQPPARGDCQVRRRRRLDDADAAPSRHQRARSADRLPLPA